VLPDENVFSTGGQVQKCCAKLSVLNVKLYYCSYNSHAIGENILHVWRENLKISALSFGTKFAVCVPKKNSKIS
jgi:hypothetical protein